MNLTLSYIMYSFFYIAGPRIPRGLIRRQHFYCFCYGFNWFTKELF